MRELKFRAWHEGKMVHWELFRSDDTYLLDVEVTIYKDTDPIMQYTGLKDKNGREIYEGDIVRYTRFNWKCFGHREDRTDLVQICEVYWDDEGHAFREQGKFPSGGGWSGYLTFEDNRADKNEIEVIGNIYENPKLLGD